MVRTRSMQAAARAAKRRRNASIPTEILAEFVQGLPAELFNYILEYTLELDTPKALVIDEFYRPPKQLQINSGSRQEIAAKYYSDTVFVITEETRDTFKHWLQSLALSHFEQITRVHTFKPPSESILGKNDDCTRMLARSEITFLETLVWFGHNQVVSRDIQLPKQTISYYPPGEDDLGSGVRVTSKQLTDQMRKNAG